MAAGAIRAEGGSKVSDSRFAGGCQCGAVRYAFDEVLDHAHVCHCRMCQKAVAGPFAVFLPVAKSRFRLTRGELSYFHSSGVARRGFCPDCGTPLTFDYPADDGIGVLVGSLDEPDQAPPVIQYGNESRVSWFDSLCRLPGNSPTYEDDPAMLERIASSNRQHPDHDTSVWPPAG